MLIRTFISILTSAHSIANSGSGLLPGWTEPGRTGRGWGKGPPCCDRRPAPPACTTPLFIPLLSIMILLSLSGSAAQWLGLQDQYLFGLAGPRQAGGMGDKIRRRVVEQISISSQLPAGSTREVRREIRTMYLHLHHILFI